MRPLEESARKMANLAYQEAILHKEEELFNRTKGNRVEANEILEFLKTDRFVLDKHSESDVAAFYKGRSIFITGASGFVGKCLLEKLLRSCPDLKKIFILMRPKRGVEIEERVKTILNSELFDRLRKFEDGLKQLDKIVPIRGDITEPLFGISNHDIELMGNEVSVIFHSAATVKFVEPIKVAVANNVVSVNNLIDFAGKISNLEALVHVSTAYSNCDRKHVDEIFYETPIKPSKLIDITEWMDAEMLDKIAPVLLGNRPNTYTYTKAVAESLLVEKSKKIIPDVPIAMIRPSIVAGIWRQPIRGWVDNFNGPTGAILSMMTGAIQAMLACPDFCADIVPVDIVANLIICAAQQVHKQHREPSKRLQKPFDQNENISLYNCVSGTLNPVAWRDVAGGLKGIALKYPCNNLMRMPGTLLLANEHLFAVFNFLNHTIVAYSSDFFLKLIGRKPTFVKIYKRLMRMIETLKPFSTNQWLFKCTNVTCLYESLSPIDKELFNFDVRQISWCDYLNRYYVGSKIFALKDDPNKLPIARHRLKRMSAGSRFAQFMFLLITYYFLLSGTSLEDYAIQSLKRLFSFDLRTLEESRVSSYENVALGIEA